MRDYIHKVQYYETDKMGITHHSNYVRFMEEARVDFFEQIGWPYDRFEKEGIASPVVSVSLDYKAPTTYPDTIEIEVRVAEFKGVRLTLEYEMKCGGKVCCIAHSQHCFVNGEGKLVKISKDYPKFNECLLSLVKN